MTAVMPAPAAAEERNLYEPGTVGVPCTDHARYHSFTTSLVMLDVPDDTDILIRSSASIVDNMNEIVGAMQDESPWLWVIGDDHTFPRDVILRLLAHDVDIVVPLCARRGPPFNLVAFDIATGQDQFGRPTYHVLEYKDIPEPPGLMEIAAAGTAGMLIKREVLDAIGNPWFRNSDGMSMNEDVEFCRRARELGFKVWLDTSVAIGHMGLVNIVPSRVDGQRGFALNFGGGGGNSAIFIPGGIRSDDPGTPDVRTGTADWK